MPAKSTPFSGAGGVHCNVNSSPSTKETGVIKAWGSKGGGTIESGVIEGSTFSST